MPPLHRSATLCLDQERGQNLFGGCGRGHEADNDAGFTLIEIAVVLILILLMTMTIMPSVRTFHLSRLKHETRRLAGRVTFLYDQAAANKLVLRLTCNFDAPSYFVSRLGRHSPHPGLTPYLE